MYYMSRNIKEFLELLKGMVDILNTSGWNLMGIAHYAISLVYVLLLFQPKRILGVGLCARPTFFFSFSVFDDFLNRVFGHL